MKRSIFIAISILLILLLTSCQQTPVPSPETESVKTTVSDATSVPETESVNETETMVSDAISVPETEAETSKTSGSSDYSAEIEQDFHLFTSIDEFKSFCASKPTNFKGFFMDLYEFFPELKTDEVILENIQVYDDHRFYYSIKTKDEKGGFYLGVFFHKGIGNMTAEELIPKHFQPYDEVIQEDFTKTQNKPASDGSQMYIYSGEGYSIIYTLKSGSIRTISICTGDIQIMITDPPIGPSYFNHDDLRAIACLRTDTPERDEAIKRIVAYCQALQKEHA